MPFYFHIESYPNRMYSHGCSRGYEVSATVKNSEGDSLISLNGVYNVGKEYYYVNNVEAESEVIIEVKVITTSETYVADAGISIYAPHSVKITPYG